MKTNFEDIIDFHQEYQVPCSHAPALLDLDAHNFRRAFLQEELDEFQTSYAAQDIEGCADALVDLVYVAMGTALMMGIPWQRIWDEVQRANMTKRLAKPDGSDSKRGSSLDVVKPPGWLGPSHEEALAEFYGFFNATGARRQAELERAK